jgi:hypothetical protein
MDDFSSIYWEFFAFSCFSESHTDPGTGAPSFSGVAPPQFCRRRRFQRIDRALCRLLRFARDLCMDALPPTAASAA